MITPKNPENDKSKTIAGLVEDHPDDYFQPPREEKHTVPPYASELVEALNLAVRLVAKQTEELSKYKKDSAAYASLFNGSPQNAAGALTPELVERLEAVLAAYNDNTTASEENNNKKNQYLFFP